MPKDVVNNDGIWSAKPSRRHKITSFDLQIKKVRHSNAKGQMVESWLHPKLIIHYNCQRASTKGCTTELRLQKDNHTGDCLFFVNDNKYHRVQRIALRQSLEQTHT